MELVIELDAVLPIQGALDCPLPVAQQDGRAGAGTPYIRIATIRTQVRGTADSERG